MPYKVTQIGCVLLLTVVASFEDIKTTNHNPENTTMVCSNSFGSESCSTSSLKRATIYSTKINVQLGEEKYGNINLGAYDEGLTATLTDIIHREMKECFLTIAYDAIFEDSLTLASLLRLENSKQVVDLNNGKGLDDIQWHTSMCGGFIFLMEDGKTLDHYMNTPNKEFYYDGKFVLVGPALDVLVKICNSEKGLRTEHIAGLIPSSTISRWLIHTKEYAASPPLTLLGIENRQNKEPIFKDIMRDMKGSELKLVTFEWKPSVFYAFDENDKVVDYYGIDIFIVQTMADILNFKMVVVEPPPNEYFGGQTEDGNWTGLVGMVARNEADIGAVDLFFTSERFGVVDFCGPFMVEASCFLARVASPLPRWQSLTFPFSAESWLAFLLILLISGVTMYCLSFLNWLQGSEDIKPGVMVVLIPFGAYVRQSVSEANVFKNFSSRVFLAGLWFYCIIFTTAYSSNLTAFLTIQRLPPTFETIKELKDTDLFVGGLGPFFAAATDSDDLKDIASRFKIYSTPKDLLVDVEGDKAVAFLPRNFLEYATVATLYDGQRDPRNIFRIMQECFMVFPMGMYAQKNSILKRKFDQIISRMIQAGLIRKWFFDAVIRSDKEKLKREQREGKSRVVDESNDLEGKVLSLGIDHLQGIFFVFVMGCLLASVVFLGELVCISKSGRR